MASKFFDEDDDDFEDSRREQRRRVRDFSQELAPEMVMPVTPPPPRPIYNDASLPGPRPVSSYGARRPRFTPAEPVLTGEPEAVTVKWFNPEKGFGFVKDARGQDLFIHISVVRAAGMESLADGQELTIQRGPGRKPNSEAANKIILADAA